MLAASRIRSSRGVSHRQLLRFNSSSSAQKASSQASAAVSKGQEYAKQIGQKLQAQASAAASSGSNALGSMSGRFGTTVNRIIGLREPIVYYSKVSAEVAKQGLSRLLL